MAHVTAYARLSRELIAARKTESGSDRSDFLRRHDAQIVELEELWRRVIDRSCLIPPHDLISIL
jgi:hypothetical protein